MNVIIYLQYDGTDFHGWQVQPEKPTVQGAVSDAIRAVTGEDIMPVGCGRTDSGVHAKQYTASFKTSSSIPVERIPYALNTHLAEGIICTGAETADDSFCANRSAKAKTYTYTIDNSEFSDVFLSRFAWHFKYPLDVSLMQTAANAFLGTHDFIGFASSGFSVKTTVRTIHKIDVSEVGDIITINITGNGFLYNMVRIIAGTLAWVGCGRIKAEDMSDIISSCDRKRAGITAPAKGLCLKEVFY